MSPEGAAEMINTHTAYARACTMTVVTPMTTTRTSLQNRHVIVHYSVVS